MANRYWVGGAATWDGTAGTKWALTSGGAGGQAVPTTSDDVFFDAASGANTVTVSGSRVAKSVNCTGFTGTLAGTSTPSLSVAGGITLSPSMTFNTSLINLIMTATGTLTTAGKSLNSFTVSGGICTLGDALTCTGSLTLTTGVFNSASFSLNINSFSSSNTNARTLTITNSTITLTLAGLAWSVSTSTNLTLNVSGSTIIFTGVGVTANWGSSLTYNNVQFTGTSSTRNTSAFGGSSCTFNTVEFNNAGFSTITFPSGGTVTIGTLLFSNKSKTSSYVVQGATAVSTLVLTNAPDLDYVAIGSITISGVSAFCRNGCDLGSNTGITFYHQGPRASYQLGL